MQFHVNVLLELSRTLKWHFLGAPSFPKMKTTEFEMPLEYQHNRPKGRKENKEREVWQLAALCQNKSRISRLQLLRQPVHLTTRNTGWPQQPPHLQPEANKNATSRKIARRLLIGVRSREARNVKWCFQVPLPSYTIVTVHWKKEQRTLGLAVSALLPNYLQRDGKYCYSFFLFFLPFFLFFIFILKEWLGN